MLNIRNLRITRFINIIIKLTIYLFVPVFLNSCIPSHTRYVTQTSRSGAEQLLVSKAVDDAVNQAKLDIEDKKIFIDISSLVKDEEPYIVKALTHRFLDLGALITDDKKNADFIASALVKCAGTDGSEFGFGIPSLPIPLFNISTPEVNMLSGNIQSGDAVIEISLFSPDGVFKEKTKTLAGTAYIKRYEILFIPVARKKIH